MPEPITPTPPAPATGTTAEAPILGTPPTPPAAPAGEVTPLTPPPAPTNYELVIKGGSILPTEAIEKVAEFAKQHKLSNEAAQAVLDREGEVLASYVESSKSGLEEQRKIWRANLQNDKEFGGANFSKNVELAHRFIKQFDPDGALQKALNETGLGDFDAFVKFAMRAGSKMAEDTVVMPGAGVSAKPPRLEDLLYPTTAKKE